MEFQHTLQHSLTFSGYGIHSGQAVSITLHPAPPQHGYRFKRSDLPNLPVFKADADYVTNTQRNTSLSYQGNSVQTIEHVLAALAGLGIDNVLIELDAPEAPILDGSAAPFVAAILEAGIETQNAPRDYFQFTEHFYFKHEATNAEYIVTPADNYCLTAMLDYPNTPIGKQYATYNAADNNFADAIAPARTFCLWQEIETLLQHQLIKGGDWTNALVIAQPDTPQTDLDRVAAAIGKPSGSISPQGYLLPNQPRYDNEPARHKLLDFMGDIALVGTTLKARIFANRPGHTANAAFARALKAYIKKQRPLQAIPKYDPNLPTVYDVRRVMQSLPHRYPFLLVDKIVSLTDKQVVGIKNVTMNEEFFQGHFPGHPIMPGVMIVEAMAQIGGVMMFHSIENPEQYVTYFLRIEQAKFRYPVIPGDTLVIQLSIVSPLRRGICELAGLAYVGSRLVAEANFAAQIVKK